MLCFVADGLDSDFKQTLLSDNLLCLLHVNTGKFNPHILGNAGNSG